MKIHELDSGGYVAEVPTSRNNGHYLVQVDPDAHMKCQCKGYVYNNTCRHINALIKFITK